MADLLLGLQWGDEGKGKIVDILASTFKVRCSTFDIFSDLKFES